MKFNHSIRIFLISSVASLGFLSGCAVQRSLTKAEPTDFLKSTGHAGDQKIARLPFERAWRDRSVDASNYTHVVIRPVSTKYLRSKDWVQNVSTYVTSETSYRKHAEELAKFWDGQLVKAFNVSKNHLRLTSSTAQPNTLIIEIALTEVVFGQPVANAASYAVVGGSVANAAMFSPSVAFEARVRDAATGRIVATASDRRSSKLKLIDLNKFTYTQANREICTEWSLQFMQAFNKDMFPKVQRSYFGLY